MTKHRQSVNISIKIKAVETPPFDANNLKSKALKELWESIKHQLKPGTAFQLANTSSGQYEMYSYLIPHIAGFISQNDLDAIYELWHLISDIPKDIINFAFSAQLSSEIPQETHAIIKAAYLIALRIGWGRGPEISLLHGAREIVRIAFQNPTMEKYRDLRSANALFADLLKSSFNSTYKIDVTSLSQIEPQHLVEAAIRLCWGKRQFKSGMSKGALIAFPAQEMIRARHGEQCDSNEEVLWRKRWTSAGGALFNDRIIALKTDPIWCKISRFGKPYPPFDFRSCMDVFDVGRGECMKLGLVSNNKQIAKPRKQKYATSPLKSIVERHEGNGCLKPLLVFALIIGTLIYLAYHFGFIDESLLNIFKY